MNGWGGCLDFRIDVEFRLGKAFHLEEVAQGHQIMNDRDFFGKLVIES